MVRKTIFECIECGRIFKRVLTDKTGEVECPNCHGVDIEVIGMERKWKRAEENVWVPGE